MAMPLLKKDKTIFDFKGNSSENRKTEYFHKTFSEKFTVIVNLTF